ncbi:MAG: DoxX family protein [Patescibacteria group bacterium]
MNKFINRLQNADLGIFFIRLAIGIVFVHAGWLKLSDMDMAVTGFAAGGMPAFLAYLVAYGEFIGGILLILGLWVRYAAIVIGIIMIVAIFKVHLVNGFGMSKGGFEYPLVLLLGALSIITLGEGKYSVLRLFKN